MARARLPAAAFLALLLSLTFGVAGQLLMKAAAMRSVTAPVEWSTLLVLATAIAVYSLGILSWIFALRYLPLSVAYPLTSLNYVGILAGSYYWFGEQLTAARMIGVALIFIGVLLVVLRARAATVPVPVSGGQ